MAETPSVRNEFGGIVSGLVVQAGAIDQVWLSGARCAQQPPRQLPGVVRDFTGRSEHLAVLNALLSNNSGAKATGAVVISAVDGTAGIGKTTLAVYWAHQVQHQFPDGTLYVNLRGYGPGDPATTSEVLDGFLQALGAPVEWMPVGVEARTGLFRSLLAERQVLMVLDNAGSADQVRPLLPGAPGCVVVVTSRDSLTGLVITESAHRLTLDLLTETEALELVTGIIQPARAAAEPEAVTDLIRLCARLPLALRIAAGRIAAHPHNTVADIAAELADEQERLEVLSRCQDERATVRAVFDWSYERLPSAQARLFRRLGLHPGPEISLYAAAAVANLDPPTTRQLLEGLTSVHLIEPVTRDRYRFHDLLRAYAADQARRHDSLVDRDLAVKALLTWYAHTSWTCSAQVFPAQRQFPLRIETPDHVPPIATRSQALQWLDTELANLLAALHRAVYHDLQRHVVHLADGVRFLHLRGAWEEQFVAQALGIAAAQRSGDRIAESRFRIAQGENRIEVRQWSDALAELNHALALGRDLGDRTIQVAGLNAIGGLFIDQQQFEEATRYLQDALPLSRDIDTGRWEAVIEGNLSRACSSVGRYREALDHAKRGLDLRRYAGDPDGESSALHGLARAWLGLGEYQKAAKLCRDAIALGRMIGNSIETSAWPLYTLGESLHHTGCLAEAVRCWQDAAALFDEYGYPWRAAQIRERLRIARTRS